VWEVGDRGWISITAGIAVDGVSGQGASGKDNEHKGLAGWNFAGLDWYFIIGLIFAVDLVVDQFGLYLAPVIMIGSESVIPGVGFGIAFSRRVGIGVIVPFSMLGVIVPAVVAVIGSAAIGILLLVLIIVGVANWIKKRSDKSQRPTF
jgi:hypothetical protein